MKSKLKETIIILKYLIKHPVRFFRALEIPRLSLRSVPRLSLGTPRGRKITAATFLVFLLIFGTYKYITRPLPTLNSDLAKAKSAGEKVLSDFQSMPSIAIAQTKDNYQVKDDLKDEGIHIQNNTQDGMEIQANTKPEDQPKLELNINFPKDYAKPIEVKLDDQRTITIQDNSKEKFSNQILTNEVSQGEALGNPKASPWDNPGKPNPQYLKYQSGRKSIYYSYQKDLAP